MSLLFALSAATQTLQLQQQSWGHTPDGEEVQLFTLSQQDGVRVSFMTLGGIITSLETADRNGNYADVVLGFESLEQYLEGHPKFGALMGRVTNRIKNAEFTLDGTRYQLETNAGEHHIHGGSRSFDKVVWQYEVSRSENAVGVVFTHRSPDGEAGFPGNVDARVAYTLQSNGDFIIDYQAVTDQPTHVNMTNHAYFNLNGCKANIYDHQIQIMADYYTDADGSAMPNGQILAVEGTALDLTEWTRIGDRIGAIGPGFDHNYVIRKEPGALALAAKVIDPSSGRTMEVWTTQPGVQFYTANWLQGRYAGKGVTYDSHMGLCLETQHFPASANYPHFPTTVLRPGQVYHEQAKFRFTAE